MPDNNYRTKEQILNGMDEYEFFARGYKDFRFFSEKVFGITLEDKQEELANEIEENNRVATIAFTGFGKCLKKGTEVLMYDGSIKKIEDVQIGEQMMGDDSKPRNVVDKGNGFGMLYKIIPVKGEPYYVNDEHILSLKYTNCQTKRFANKKIDICIKDYLALNKAHKHWLKGYHVPVDFKEQKVEIDPYWLGCWIGDGRSTSQMITTPDAEIRDCIRGYAKRLGLSFSVIKERGTLRSYSIVGPCGKKNMLREKLKGYNLFGNKHIPEEYKINSREIRLNLLAGLVDADGHNAGNVLDFVFKGKKLSEDIAFLCRSLGFCVTLKECTKGIKSTGFIGTYYRLIVSGDLSVIPTRIKRKQFHKRMQKKDALVTGISVEEAGEGEWHGVVIDGNRRFLLKDFTVTHNTFVLGQLYPIWKMYYNRGYNIMIISPSMDTSTKNLRILKSLLEGNEILKDLVPKIKDKWSETEIITSNKCHVFCKPFTTNVAGVHVDYVLADEVAKFKDEDLFNGVVLTRITSKAGTKFAAISTPVRANDLIHKLHENPEFKGLIYKAYDDEGNSICPNRFPREELEKTRRMIGEYAFGREYMCDCTSVGDRAFFDINSIVGCFDKNVEFTQECMNDSMRFIGADFAMSAKGDYSVFTVIEVVGTKAIIKEIIRLRGTTREEQVNILVSLNNTYNPSAMIVDSSNVGQIFMDDLLQKGLPVIGQSFSPKEREDLFINMKRIFDNGQLVIPRGPESEAMTDILFNEISTVTEEQTPTKQRTYQAKSANDDMIFSLMMSCRFVVSSIIDTEMPDELKSKDKTEKKILTQDDMWIC